MFPLVHWLLARTFAKCQLLKSKLKCNKYDARDRNQIGAEVCSYDIGIWQYVIKLTFSEIFRPNFVETDRCE